MKLHNFNNIIKIALLFTLCFSCTGCQRNDHGLNPKKPITLTMWHNFGGEMQTTMDTLIDEFNSTVGKDKGIIINVTAITSSKELQDTLESIVEEVPGAPEMPDITTSYPKTAILFQEKGLLANLDPYFTEKELASYIPSYVEEGRFGDNGLYVFPFAKSTEILYVNKTLFDRFAAETNITMDCFNSFEGIADASLAYYEWTDRKTPEIPDDGKTFFSADSWFNLAQAGMIQLGDSFFLEERLNVHSDTYTRIFDTLSVPILMGGFALYDGYSSDLSKTGDLICSTGSSAGILFYGDTITYADNTTEQVEYSILPYPVFKDGQKCALSRGNGLIVRASDDKREYAASLFLKWFTKPDKNMQFVSSTGYLPVTKEAFEIQIPLQMASVKDARIKKMLQAVMQMQKDYTFFTPPTFSGLDSLSDGYNIAYYSMMSNNKSAVKAHFQSKHPERDDTYWSNYQADISNGVDTFRENFVIQVD